MGQAALYVGYYGPLAVRLPGAHAALVRAGGSFGVAELPHYAGPVRASYGASYPVLPRGLYYFCIQLSGLTELLFGLVLVGGAALAVAGRRGRWRRYDGCRLCVRKDLFY